MNNKITFCPNCGARLEGNVDFCPNCGFKLNKAESSSLSETVQPTEVKQSVEKSKVQVFCPNCGHPLKPGADFCSNCGYNLKTKQVSKQVSSQTVNNRRQPRQPRKPMSKKNKIIFSVVGVLLVAFIGFYIWGHNYYSMTNQVNRITSKITDPSQDLSPYVTTVDNSVKVTKDSVKPLQEYYRDHHEAIIGLNASLKTGVGNSDVSLVKKGSYWLIFPKYQLQVSSYQPEIVTNHENSVVKVNGKSIGNLSETSDGYTKKLNPVLPGKYTIVVNSKVAGRNLKASSNCNIWSDKSIDMDIRTQTFTVKSVPNGVVYINDKKVGTLDEKGEITFDSYPITRNMQLYVSFNNDGKTIKSETVTDLSSAFNEDGSYDYSDLSDVVSENEDGYVVEPQWKGVVSNDDATDLLNNAFTSPDSDDFIDGSDNKDYKDIKTMENAWDNDDKILSYDTDVTVESIYPASDNSCSVVFKVTYEFEHEDSSRKQVMEYKGGILQKDGDNEKIKTIGKGKIISDKNSD